MTIHFQNSGKMQAVMMAADGCRFEQHVELGECTRTPAASKQRWFDTVSEVTGFGKEHAGKHSLFDHPCSATRPTYSGFAYSLGHLGSTKEAEANRFGQHLVRLDHFETFQPLRSPANTSWYRRPGGAHSSPTGHRPKMDNCRPPVPCPGTYWRKSGYPLTYRSLDGTNQTTQLHVTGVFHHSSLVTSNFTSKEML